MSEVKDIEDDAACACHPPEPPVLDKGRVLRSSIGGILALAKLLADNEEGNLSAKQVDCAQAIYSAGTDMLGMVDELVKETGNGAGAPITAMPWLLQPPPASYPFFLRRREAVGRPPYRGRRSRRADDGAVLVVGRETALAETVRKRVREQGYQCELAVDAQAAKTMMREHKPDAVIFVSEPDAEPPFDPPSVGTASVSSCTFRAADGAYACIVPERSAGSGLPGAGGTGASLDEALADAIRFLHKAVGMPQLPRRRIPTRRRRGPLDLVGKKVLIVDADIRNLYAMTAALERQGMAVAHAESAEQGLAVLEEQPDTDAAIMDPALPGSDACGAIRRVRADPRFASLPVIALTGMESGERERCLGAGASDCLAKPVNDDQLVALLRAWLLQPR